MHREMLVQYSIPISLLSLIGLWPFTSERIRRFRKMIYTFCMIFICVSQLTPFASGKATKQDVLKNVSFMIITLGVTSKYFFFKHQAGKIKELVEGVNRDWNAADDEELKVVKEHADMGKRYSMLFAVFIYLSTFGAMGLHFSCTILDIVLPLNESRPYTPPFMTEYFIDEQKYYLPIATWQSLLILIGGSVYVATESLYFMWMMHGASLYRLVSYNVNVAVLDSIDDSYVTEKTVNRNGRKRLTRAIMMHDRAETFLKNVKSTLKLVYAILLILGVTALSTNLFSLSQSSFEADTMNDTLFSLMFVISELGYMFYVNFVAQKIIDAGGDVFVAIYDTEWYKTPLSTQKSLIFIMMRSIKAPEFNMLLAFNASFEGFATLVKTSVSYFTVMSSTTQ